MRVRLFLSYALIVLVTVATVVFVARQSAANEVRAFMYRGGMAGPTGLVNALEAYYRQNQTWQGAESVLGYAGHGAGQGRGMGAQGMEAQGMGGMMSQRLRLADVQGNVVVDSGAADPAQPQAGERLSSTELRSALALQVDGKTVGYLLPEGGVPFGLNDEVFLLSRLSRGAIIAGLVAGGLSLLLALLLAYWLMRPVRALTQAASRLGEGDLSQRVQVHGKDELAALGQSFNHMADSLQESETSRRAMTADIAHELRTPLAVQRANLEALQDGIYPLNVDNLQPVLEQNLLLTRLVEDLRTLALAESGQLTLEKTPTDLPALAERVVARFEPQAQQHQVHLHFTCLPGISPSQPDLELDAMRVEQILGNLLSNALRYVPEGGDIWLRLDYLPQAARLTVQDNGAGIPAEALPHVFERFYRADKARSRNEGGSGLGLAIARQLAEAHHGTLTAANAPQGGAIFTLTLPLG